MSVPVLRESGFLVAEQLIEMDRCPNNSSVLHLPCDQAFFVEIKKTSPHRLPNASLQALKGIQFLERRPAQLTFKTGNDVQAVQRRKNPEATFFMHR